MAIPDFTEYGLLPSGIHPATKQEMADRYLGNPNRAAIWQGFELFLTELRKQDWFSCVSVIWIDGGFTSDKPHTKDIDVVLDISSASEIQFYRALEWHSNNHGSTMALYKVDCYPNHPLLKNNFREFFAYIKEDERLQRNTPLGTLKGLLELQP